MPPLRAKKLLKCLNKLFLLPHVFLFSKKNATFAIQKPDENRRDKGIIKYLYKKHGSKKISIRKP